MIPSDGRNQDIGSPGKFESPDACDIAGHIKYPRFQRTIDRAVDALKSSGGRESESAFHEMHDGSPHWGSNGTN